MASIGPSVYCLCGKPYDKSQFMIQCDVCKEWFHGRCVSINENDSADIEKYHCPKCHKIFGDSIYKERTNWHRHDHTESDPHIKAVQSGTPVFVKELKLRHFTHADDIIAKLKGSQITVAYLIANGFDYPILVERKSGLGLTVPAENITLRQIEELIGPERMLDVIDVGKQETLKMTMNEFIDYFLARDRKKVLNIISLEYSNTKLSDYVEAPLTVRKLSWAEQMWPKELPPDFPYERPVVDKYCLIGCKESYTDFHIDFGGSSVWYHVLQGEKVFYLIKPTPANLQLYERWMISSTQSETFFGDQVDSCYRFVLRPGQTLFIPTGWIHAVLTSVDSLVFGGNFLHSLNIALQLQIFEMERRMKTPLKYQFPSFQALNWFAAKQAISELQLLNTSGNKIPPFLVHGIKVLLMALKSWLQESTLSRPGQLIPESFFEPLQIIKELNKELKLAEKLARDAPCATRKSTREKFRKVFPDSVEEIDCLFQPQLTVPDVYHSQESKNVTAVEMNEDHVYNNFGTYAAMLGDKDIESLVPQEQSRYPSMGELDSRAHDHQRKRLLMKPTATERGDQAVDPNDLYAAEDGRIHSAIKIKLPIKRTAKGRKGAGKKRRRQTPKGSSSSSPAKAPRRENLRPKNVLHSTKKDDSVYDFHDSDEDRGLVVDENPAKNAKNRKGVDDDLGGYQYQAGDIKIKFVNPVLTHPNGNKGGDHWVSQSQLPSSGSTSSGQPTDPQSFDDHDKFRGIDDLLLASNYASSDDNKIVDDRIGNGRTSPSIKEAIAGMLSIGRGAVEFTGNRGNLGEQLQPHYHREHNLVSPIKLFMHNKHAMMHPLLAGGHHQVFDSEGSRSSDSRVSASVDKYSSSEDDVSDIVEHSHQDAEYIYPSLETTEEDLRVFKHRGNKNDDEPWNPKTKLKASFPKKERPTRENAKRESVESGLAAAALKLSQMPPPKRPYKKRAPKPVPPPPPPPPVIDEPQPSTSSAPPQIVECISLKKSIKKHKKGELTAKQRLGKILKIHKMVH